MDALGQSEQGEMCCSGVMGRDKPLPSKVSRTWYAIKMESVLGVLRLFGMPWLLWW
jgi:hypothetical protein